jgi:hypothetical protein
MSRQDPSDTLPDPEFAGLTRAGAARRRFLTRSGVLTEGARPLRDNRYKVELARRSVSAALRVAGGVA